MTDLWNPETIKVFFIGYGLGNSNLIFTGALNNQVVAAFLNLYVNFFLSAGIGGLFLLCYFLVLPIKKIIFSKKKKNYSQINWVLSAYMGWLIMFSIHNEEFSLMFGIIFALLVYQIKKLKNNSGVPMML